MRSETRSTSSVISAAAAYRKDVEKRKGPIGKDDGAWIAIATMVGQIAAARGKDRRRILDEAAGMAAELFEPAVLDYGCAFDPPAVDAHSSVALLRLLAEHVERRGSLHLAEALLRGLSSVLPRTSVNAGRVLAQRGRIAWTLGNLNLARAQIQRVRTHARIVESNELQVLAWASFIALSQLRGNYPEVRRWSTLVVRRAEECGYGRLASAGYHGLMIATAAAKSFDEAIKHGWTAYRLRAGDPRAQTNMLGNIAQLFFDAGYPAVARDAFVRVLASQPPIRVTAPALGGYALASAALGDTRAVMWASAEATNMSDLEGFRYESASTLLDCADALDSIGDEPYASVVRARASAMAQYGGFNELIMRIEQRQITTTSPATKALHVGSDSVAHEIARLPEAQVPDHLELLGV